MTRQFSFFRIFVVCISVAVLFYTALGISQQIQARRATWSRRLRRPGRYLANVRNSKKTATISPIFLAAQARCRHRRYFRSNRIKGGCWDSTLLAIH